MLQTPKATSYIGCIGDDEFGKQMEKLSSQGGVNVSCCTLQASFSMPIFCDNFIFCHRNVQEERMSPGKKFRAAIKQVRIFFLFGVHV